MLSGYASEAGLKLGAKTACRRSSTASHRLRIRPDIIVHVPFDRGFTQARDQGNFTAIELKRRATAKTAKKAFANLALMKRALKYPLTIFINVDSEQTHSGLCPKSIIGQTVCFAVLLRGDKPIV
jgi:hypothetical protein